LTIFLVLTSPNVLFPAGKAYFYLGNYSRHTCISSFFVKIANPNSCVMSPPLPQERWWHRADMPSGRLDYAYRSISIVPQCLGCNTLYRSQYLRRMGSMDTHIPFRLGFPSYSPPQVWRPMTQTRLDTAISNVGLVVPVHKRVWITDGIGNPWGIPLVKKLRRGSTSAIVDKV